MTFRLVWQVVLALVVAAATAWEARQLWRRPRDPALRVLVAGMLGLTVSLTLGVSLPPLEPLDDFMDESGLGNVVWMFMAWSYATFFWQVTHHPALAERQRRVRASFVVFVIAAVAHLVIVQTPEGQVRTVAFVVSCYGYALVMFGLGAGRAVRYLGRLRHVWARSGVLLVTIGGAAMSIGVDVTELVRYGVLGVVAPGLRPPWMSDFYNVGRVGGQIVLAIGLGLVPLATLIVRARARLDRRRRARLERAMRPLWELMATEFPWLVLPGPRNQSDLARTTTEITDGLARLATFVHHSPEDVSTRTPADLVVEALAQRSEARRASGDSRAEPEAAEPPYPQLEPDFGEDWRARARWMVELGQELERRGVTPAEEVDSAIVRTP